MTTTRISEKTMELVRSNNVNIGLANENVQAVAAILNRVLADAHILYIKTRNYHWNVTGPLFHSLHEMFEEQYDGLADDIDDIAERTRAIGAPAIGTMTEFLQHTTLKEQPGDYPDAMTMVANLMADHEAIIRSLRKDLRACDEQYDDMGTSDFLTGLMEKHEKTAWMLRALLEERA
jgi:starvation-inducible DNA-binding protein